MRAEAPLAIRSYRLCFDLERRIHKIDRWRIPLPYGLPLRGIAYGACVLAAILIASGLPLIGALLSLVHPAIRLVVAPVGIAYALGQLRIDGRPAHSAGIACLRLWLAPGRVAGFRAVTAPGPQRLADLAIAPDERSPRYRPALLRGPASLLLRYPASAQRRGRTLRLRPRDGGPMWRAKHIALKDRQKVRVG